MSRGMSVQPIPLRVDAHMHFWEYDAQAYAWIGQDMEVLAKDRLPAEVRPQLIANDFDAVIAVQARAGREETSFLLAQAEKHPWIAAVVGWEDLRAADLQKSLEGWAVWSRLRGFRHQIQDEPDARGFMNDSAVDQGMALLQKRGYVYDLLVLHHQMNDGLDFCARHDKHWLVLDHLGKPPLRGMKAASAEFDAWREALHRYGALPHVMCKLSGLVTEADWQVGIGELDRQHMLRCLDEALEAFGPERLLFGSDWPVCLLAEPYEQVFALVKHWAVDRLSPQERVQLWGVAAERCYGLNSNFNERPLA